MTKRTIRLLPLAAVFLWSLASCSAPAVPDVEDPPVCDGVLQAAEGTVDGPFDQDGDGFLDGSNPDCQAVYPATVLDCDDTNAAVNPGVPELLCSGVDEDCNPATGDEEDRDGDGAGSCTDCNDIDMSIGPMVAESCDGIDNNCDGVVDEGFPDGDADDVPDCTDPCPLDNPDDANGDGVCDSEETGLPTGVVVGTYTASPGWYSAVLDWQQHQIFLSQGSSGTVEVVPLDGSPAHTITTGYTAEWMHYEPVRNEVLVSLPSGMHSAYWWDEDQEGYVAAIDAATLADPTPIWIPRDPWQLVGDGTGYLYVGSASGQWTNTVSVNLDTGIYSVNSFTIRQGTKIQMHPSLDRIYGADNGLSPSDIERWNVNGDGALGYAYDSPYHGTYPMCGDLRIHPRGDTIYTRCGHIFLATNSTTNDLNWFANLGTSWTDIAFEDEGDRAFVIDNNGGPLLQVWDTVSLTALGTVSLSGPPARVFTGPGYLVVIRDLGVSTAIDVLDLGML